MTGKEFTQAYDQGRMFLADAELVSQRVDARSGETIWRKPDGALWREVESNDGTGQTFDYSLTRIVPVTD